MAQYKSYTNTTIYYMRHTFHQINQTKKVFRDI